MANEVYELPYVSSSCGFVDTIDLDRVLPRDMTEEESQKVSKILNHKTLNFIISEIADGITGYLYEVYIPENLRDDYRDALHKALDCKCLTEEEYGFLMSLMER